MKKFIKFTFCFACLPLFLISCASTPEDEKETSVIESPAQDTVESESDTNGENLDLEQASENDSEENQAENESDAEAENEAEDKAEAAVSNDDTTEASENENEAGTIDAGEEVTEESDNSQADNENRNLQEDQLEEIEEPEVITIEYEDENPEKEEAEEIDAQDLELDYIDEIDISEDDEIRGDIIEIEDEEEASEQATEIEESESQEDVEAPEESSQESSQEETEEIIEVSRKVSMKIQEYVDITYPGKGWVYMGLTDGSKALSYFGRKLGTKDTKFTLQAKAAGTKYLHFYKNDTLTGEYIDDFIEVEVIDEKGSNKTHIAAPEYKPQLPKKAKALVEKKIEKQEETEKESTQVNEIVESDLNAPSAKGADFAPAVNQANNGSSQIKAEAEVKAEVEAENQKVEEAENSGENEKIDVNSLLKEAEVLYNNKDYSSADKKIKTFLEYAVTDRDAGLFLQGKILEAKSEIQDIKSAIEAYKTLTKNYPASQYWEEANKQIIYLNRFYLEIR
ncbi:MAG: outer membrane protein assembly factor BamD [Treponema sp.]|nr:outer membrane protein assembly factor BamD [Treponema sp.]